MTFILARCEEPRTHTTPPFSISSSVTASRKKRNSESRAGLLNETTNTERGTKNNLIENSKEGEIYVLETLCVLCAVASTCRTLLLMLVANGSWGWVRSEGLEIEKQSSILMKVPPPRRGFKAIFSAHKLLTLGLNLSWRDRRDAPNISLVSKNDSPKGETLKVKACTWKSSFEGKINLLRHTHVCPQSMTLKTTRTAAMLVCSMPYMHAARW